MENGKELRILCYIYKYAIPSIVKNTTLKNKIATFYH